MSYCFVTMDELFEHFRVSTNWLAWKERVNGNDTYRFVWLPRKYHNQTPLMVYLSWGSWFFVVGMDIKARLDRNASIQEIEDEIRELCGLNVEDI